MDHTASGDAQTALTTKALVRKIAARSAALTALWALAFDVAIGLGAAGAPTRLVAVGASLLLALSFLALAATLHQYASPPHKVWTQIGMSFATVYAALLLWNYYLQLTVVRTNPQLYGWLTMDFTRDSAFWSLETIGYTIMGLAALFCSQSLGRSRIALAVRWCLVLNAACSVLGSLGYLITTDPFNLLVILSLGVWAIAFPVAAALLAVMFTGGEVPAQ